MTQLLQCVPNFSEGRDRRVIEAIADAIRATPGAHLIDYSADIDHNRSVMTILGKMRPVAQAALAAAAAAVDRIDLRIHSGVHPRLGALDVLPVVPLADSTRDEAVSAAAEIGRTLADRLALPIYFYEWNAKSGRASALPDLRRGGFEAIQGTRLAGDRAPDLGPIEPHPTAGVAIVGARGPLIAYNVNLGSADVEVARAIARRIREMRSIVPQLEGVRALGLLLASRNQAQVSLNITLPGKTTLPAVFAFIREEASKFGVTEMESEIIGAIPAASLGGQPPEAIRWHAYKASQILETWLPGS